MNSASPITAAVIQEARERVIDELFERGEFTPENYWVLEKPEDNKVDTVFTGEQSKSVRISSLAKKMGMWVEAEILFQDPVLEGTPFMHDHDTTMTFLGMEAANQNEIELAYDFFGRLEDKTYEYRGHIVDGLLKNGRLEEAEEIMRTVDFSTLEKQSLQRRLGSLLNHMSCQENGASRALDLLEELVPDPSESDIEDKAVEISRMDQFVDGIVIGAVSFCDFETAERAVAKLSKYFGPGAAMGGGGLEDNALRTEDPNVIAGVYAVIYKHWGLEVGKKYLKKHQQDIDFSRYQELGAQVHEWMISTAMS